MLTCLRILENLVSLSRPKVPPEFARAGAVLTRRAWMRGLAALSVLSAASFFVIVPLFLWWLGLRWFLRRGGKRGDGAAADRRTPVDLEVDAVVVDISGWRVVSAEEPVVPSPPQAVPSDDQVDQAHLVLSAVFRQVSLQSVFRAARLAARLLANEDRSETIAKASAGPEGGGRRRMPPEVAKKEPQLAATSPLDSTRWIGTWTQVGCDIDACSAVLKKQGFPWALRRVALTMTTKFTIGQEADGTLTITTKVPVVNKEVVEYVDPRRPFHSCELGYNVTATCQLDERGVIQQQVVRTKRGNSATTLNCHQLLENGRMRITRKSTFGDYWLELER